MADDMAVDNLFGMPGGDGFQDVTNLFTEAAQEMDTEYLLLTEGFTLLDAMSAFEIGEPRMDSGMILEQQRRPPFDPLLPMLPQEVCWIMDRMFTCEMEWHAGNSLSQTVYTLLYVHCLQDINPDFIPRRSRTSPDPYRPQELVTIVLRAAVFGLLKSCDLSWRELSKGRVQEIEDWFGEKCDVSLIEGVPADFVIKKIDDACEWLRHSSMSSSNAALLCDRLILRKSIIQLLRSSLPSNTVEFRVLAAQARELLQRIRTQPVQSLHPDSPARLVFDPHICRRLANLMPIRIIELPPQGDTWIAIDHFLSGHEELAHLLDSPCLLTWEIAGSLRICSPEKQIQVAYVRSLAQTAVFDQNKVFGQNPPMWLVDRFFLETVGISYETILQSLILGDNASAHSWIRDIERQIVKLMVAHVRSHWYNPPRRRRLLAKSILQWHQLYDQCLQLISCSFPSDPERSTIIDCLPKAVMMWRLVATREVILSGFQQDLYSPEEVPIAYWYVARVLDVHLTCIDEVLSFVERDWDGFDEMAFQSNFLTALQIMAIAMCVITYKPSRLPFRRTSLNFMRRYKWALNPEYDSLVPALPLPDLRAFAPQVSEVLHNEYFSSSQSFRLAADILHDLSSSQTYEGLAGVWTAERRNFIAGLIDLCRRLEAMPATTPAIANSLLKWHEQAKNSIKRSILLNTRFQDDEQELGPSYTPRPQFLVRIMSTLSVYTATLEAVADGYAQ